MIGLVLALLAGALLLGVVVENARRIVDERERRRYERGRHAALMREIRRYDP